MDRNTEEGVAAGTVRLGAANGVGSQATLVHFVQESLEALQVDPHRDRGRLLLRLPRDAPPEQQLARVSLIRH